MAKININASPDEINQVVSSVAPALIPSVTPPTPPPMPTPARAGYGAFASDPLNQEAISKHITPPGTSILPPPPAPAVASRPFYGTVTPPNMPPSSPQGLRAPGNINIYNRPIVPNPDGGMSTVYSTSFGDDNGEHLIPRVSDGADGRSPHIMGVQEAEAYYRKTGQNLGTFDTPDNATAYAQALHLQQAGMTNFGGRTAQAPMIHPSAPPTPPSLSRMSPMPSILPPGMTPPSQMASVNPPQKQWASLNPPQVDTLASPSTGMIPYLPSTAPQAPQTVNPYGTPTQAEYFAANPSQQENPELLGQGWKKGLLYGGVAALQSLGSGLQRGGNPLAGMNFLNQTVARDQRTPEINAQRYRTGVIQPQIDALNAQKGVADVAHTQAQTTDIADKRQQQLAQHGLKTVVNPDGTTALVPDTDSPVYKAQQALQEKLANQTKLIQAQVESTNAQKELREAQTAYNNAKSDPNSPLFRQTSQRLAIAQQNANAAQVRAQAYWGGYLQRSTNTGLNGEVLPGAPIITGDDGQQTAVGTGNAPVAVKAQTNAARFNDVGGSLDSLDSALQDLHKTGGHLNSPAVLQALQDNQTPVAQWIQSQAAKTLTPQEREAVVKVKNAREQIMALRASVGGGVSDAQVNRLVSQVPDGTSPDYDFSKRQIETLKQSIARLTPGVATANKGLTVHGQGKPNNMVPPGGHKPAEGATKTNSSGDKIVFHNGKWGPA